jgi:hypothetical protein
MKETVLVFTLICVFSFAIGGDTLITKGEEQPALPKTIPITVELKGENGTNLTLKQVKYSLFPYGKRCAFSYKGAKSPSTIQSLYDMGFRTTVHVSPDIKAESAKAIEKAGAEIAVSGYRGLKGGYSSMIEGNTVQEAFDGIITSRLDLKKKCKGPVACGSVSGHISITGFPFERNIEAGVGYGAVIHDSNFMQVNMVGIGSYYGIILGRHRWDPSLRVMSRERFSNLIALKKAPTEKVYYQMLSQQFRGTLGRVEKGQIVIFKLRDFKQKDLRSIKRIMGKYGNHPLIWHASEGMLASYEYQKKRVHIKEVTAKKDGVIQITLGVEEDLFIPFLLAPLSLQIPNEAGVKSASVGEISCSITEAEGNLHIGIPLQKVFRNGITMELTTEASDMTIPDEMGAVLKIKNASDKKIENAELKWIQSSGFAGKPGLEIAGGTDAPFTIDAGKEVVIRVKAKTFQNAYFGITPFSAVIKGTVEGKERQFIESFEIPVAPMLSVEVHPYNQIPLPKGETQHIIILINNIKGKGRFICHKTGPCKGTVSLEIPEGMEVTPRSHDLDLKANDKTRLVFKIKNNEWSETDMRVPVLIRLEGSDKTVYIPYPGTRIIRRKALEYQPVDDKGLLAYASWDNEKFSGFDKAAGKRSTHSYGTPVTPVMDGVKGWAVGANSGVVGDSFKNIHYKRGTILCWVRRDLRVRNENRFKGDPSKTWKMGVQFSNNRGDNIWVAGKQGQKMGLSQSGITLRRYYGWGDSEGYLQAVWQGMGGQLRYVQGRYEDDRVLEWRHTAVVWDIEKKLLALYIDGKEMGKADPGKEEWYGCPWDNGIPSKGGRCKGLQPISSDHGKQQWTMRDEFYVYNRVLTPEEITENMNLVKKK